MNPIDNFYENQIEPFYSTMNFIRRFILKEIPEITENWKYGTPFFILKKKNFAYLWIDKKSQFVYLGFPAGNLIEHPNLIQRDKKFVKKYFIDPNQDIHIEELKNILLLVQLNYKEQNSKK